MKDFITGLPKIIMDLCALKVSPYSIAVTEIVYGPGKVYVWFWFLWSTPTMSEELSPQDHVYVASGVTSCNRQYNFNIFNYKLTGNCNKA